MSDLTATHALRNLVETCMGVTLPEETVFSLIFFLEAIWNKIAGRRTDAV
jgi:hypothetical protein